MFEFFLCPCTLLQSNDIIEVSWWLEKVAAFRPTIVLHHLSDFGPVGRLVTLVRCDPWHPISLFSLAYEQIVGQPFAESLSRDVRGYIF